MVDAWRECFTTFGLCTRKVALLPRTHDRKPNVFRRSMRRSGDGFQCTVATHGTVKAPTKKERHLANSLSA
jgi:hypothetical protein